MSGARLGRWAHCTNLTSKPVHPEFVQAMRDAGFDWLDVSAPPSSIRALQVIWVGERWDAGLDRLAQVQPDALRAQTIVAGSSPPSDIGPRLRAIGGWTWLESPPQPWFLEVLVQAVDRVGEPPSFDPLVALQRLGPETMSDPDSILTFAAIAAGQIGDCDHAQVIRGPTPPRGAPPELAALHRRTRAFGETMVVPDIAHAHLLAVPEPEEYRAAVTVPVQGLGTTGPTAVIHLLWRDPRLPTPEEQGAIGALSLLCNWAVGRTVRRIAAANSHSKALGALSQLSWSNEEHDESATPAPSVGPEDLVIRTARSDLVSALFDAYGGTQQMTGLWARGSPFTRADPPWMSRVENPGPPPIDVPRIESRDPIEVRTGRYAGHWAVALDVGYEGTKLGDVAATFRTPASARLGRVELRGLASALALGLRLLRRSADAHAINLLSRAVAMAAGGRSRLDRMLELVRRRMVADHAKVCLHARTPDGRRVVTVSRTDGEVDEVGWAVGEVGLVDWVLRHDDWLLIDDPVPSDQVGQRPEGAICGRLGRVGVYARSESSGPGDDERSMLLVPLHSNERVAGVLVVWRTTSDPFDPNLDVSSMLHFAPQITSAAWRNLRTQALNEERQAIKTTAKAVRSDTPPMAAHELLLAQAARLARSAAAVLLHHDPAREGRLYLGATWTARPEDEVEFAERMRGLFLSSADAPRSWREDVRTALTARLDPALRLHLRDLAWLVDHDDRPRGVVALLDHFDDDRVAVFAAELRRRTVRDFLQFAGATVGNHSEAYASWNVEQLSARRVPALRNATDILQWAARMLRDALAADAVLVYTGDQGAMTVRSTYPDCPALKGFPVEERSYTWHCIVEGKPRRVLDVHDPDDDFSKALNHKVLRKVYARLGWASGRSWLACPIVDRGRTVGLIKALTSEEGRFLGPDDELVATYVGQRAAEEFLKQHRWLMLEELNLLTNRLAAVEGAELTRGIERELSAWADRFIRAGCEIGVVALDMGSDRVLLSGVSGGPATVERLETLSRVWCTGEEKSWMPKTLLPTPHGKPPERMRCAGVALPFRVPGQEDLGGHLFLLDKRPFAVADAEAGREAAREVAILVNAERSRQELLLRIGRFRHALLGPVQGLTSAARLLGAKATGVDDNPELRTLIARVVAEAETIRLWRENQRLYFADGRIEIRPRTQALKPVVERCLERYRTAFAERNVSLELRWKPRGGLQFAFDREAIDLALSNILDNARKYTFFNRAVVVGCDVVGPNVTLYVENVGHAIPERMAHLIYQPGKRADRHDPLRIIDGEGLGLPMANALVVAHGGRLSHTCTREGVEDSDTTPFKVRFVLELPHHWSRR